MRIKIKFSGVNGNVPFATQANVNSYIHACLGRNNDYHDAKSPYSISSLLGGKMNEAATGLSFDNDAFIVVSSLDTTFMSKLLVGVISHREFAYGMKLADVEHVNEELFDGWNHFTMLTPFMIKKVKSPKGRADYWTLDDEGFEQHVRDHIVNKLKKIDPSIDLTGFELRIPDRPFNKVRRIMVKNVPNFANNCWVSIKSTKHVASMIYHLGLGQSTGSGFGTLCLNRSRDQYGLPLRKEKLEEVTA